SRCSSLGRFSRYVTDAIRHRKKFFWVRANLRSGCIRSKNSADCADLLSQRGLTLFLLRASHCRGEVKEEERIVSLPCGNRISKEPRRRRQATTPCVRRPRKPTPMSHRRARPRLRR